MTAQIIQLPRKSGTNVRDYLTDADVMQRARSSHIANYSECLIDQLDKLGCVDHAPMQSRAAVRLACELGDVKGAIQLNDALLARLGRERLKRDVQRRYDVTKMVEIAAVVALAAVLFCAYLSLLLL